MSFQGAQPASRPGFPHVDSMQRRVSRNSDGTLRHEVRLYNATGGALTSGGFYMVDYGGTTPTAPNPRVVTPATTAIMREFVVALSALADVSYGWFAYAGYVDALVEGTTDVTAGDYLKLVNAQLYVVKDATTISAASMARALAGQTANSAVAARIFLFGSRCTI